jgi:hypothetical protein
MNSISGTRLGKQVIAFQDGGLISIRDPNLEIGGLAVGDRVQSLSGNLLITDHINKLEADVTYNP